MFGWFTMTPALVVTRCTVDPSPTAQRPVEIVGRAAGFVGWLLSVLRLGSEMSLLVSQEELTIRQTGLRGEMQDVVPLNRVASVTSGHHKPLWMLGLAAIALVGGIMGLNDYQKAPAVVRLIVGVGLIVWYYHSRTTIIGVETTGGRVLSLSFKKGVAETADIDLTTAQRISARLNNAVLAASGLGRAALRRTA